MFVIPAIDIKDGRCVRLREGKMDQETIFSEDPLDMAEQWFSQGAEILHLVDLDGAIQGNPVNDKIIISIASKFKDKIIQVGGGIRTTDSASRYLDNGINRVIMGTSAIKNPKTLSEIGKKYNNSLVLALDAQNGKVRTEGWVEDGLISPSELLESLEFIDLAAVIYTDISRDGMMLGPNAQATFSLAEETSIPVIASGGVSSLDHIRELLKSKIPLEGVICGRSLYEKAFTLSEAMQIAQKENDRS